MTTVPSDSGRLSIDEKKTSSAMPIKRPGIIIGITKITRRNSVKRRRARTSAKAAAVPMTVDTSAVKAATSRLFLKASITR